MIRATAELQFQLSQRNIQSILRQLQGRMNVPLHVNTAAAERNIARVGQELRRSTGFANNFGLAVGDSARRFAAYGAGVAIIAKLAFAFKSASSEVLKFDKDMTTLSQVTGKTRENLSGITKELLNLSVKTGISVGKLGELTTTLAQAGFAGKDLSNAIEVIAKSDLAPSFDNMEDSVEGLIAIFQQFKKPSVEFGRQFGFINNLSKKYAIESKDIIEGVKRAGSVFASAGASLEEFASIMTVVRSTTRESAESIATGLKTITERIQRPEIISYLEELGVQLRDVEGKFVGPLKAFENLSAALEKRGSLAPRSLELIAVAKEIGGGRQLSKILPLLNSASQAQIALSEASKNAATSLEDDAVIAMKALSKQLDVLKADFNKFFVELSISDEFKDMAKSALTFAQALIDVAKATKPFIPIISQLGVAFGARAIVKGFSGKQSPRFAPDITNVPGFASGGVFTGSGYVRGPGTTTNDQVNAKLSNREFVIKASSTSKVGRARLEYINAFGEMPKFARGGMVGNDNPSGLSGLSNPLVSLAAFYALNQALVSMREETKDTTDTFSNFKAGIIPIIPAALLLFNGLKAVSSGLESFKGTISNSADFIAGVFSGRESSNGRSAYQKQTRTNLGSVLPEDATSKQLFNADPFVRSARSAGATKSEIKAGLEEFSKEDKRSGNINQAKAVAIQAVAAKREADIKSAAASSVVDVNRQTALRQFQADNLKAVGTSLPVLNSLSKRSLANAAGSGVRAQTQRDSIKAQIADELNQANRLRGDSRNRLSANGNVRDIESKRNIAERRRITAESSFTALTTANKAVPGTIPASVLARAKREQTSARSAFTRADSLLTTTRSDIAQFAAQTKLIKQLKQSADALDDVTSADKKLLTAKQKQIAALNASTNVTSITGSLRSRIGAGLREGVISRVQRAGSAAADFGDRNSNSLNAIATGFVVASAALSAGISAIAQKNAQAAIELGDSQEAYNQTLIAATEEQKQNSILTAGAIGAGIGTIFGPLGTVVGGVIGALVGLTGAAEYLSDTILGTDSEEIRKGQALIAKNEAEVVAVNKLINDGIKDFTEKSSFEDKSISRRSLVDTALKTTARIDSGSATTAQTKDGLQTIFDTLRNEFNTVADAAIASGGGFAEINKKAPELVFGLNHIAQQLNNPNLIRSLQEQSANIEKFSKLALEENVLRARALQELENNITYQKRVNASLNNIASGTRSISQIGDSASLRQQSISGSVTSQPIKEFGVDLKEIGTQLTTEFYETLTAVGSFNDELRGQAEAYHKVLAASELFAKELPSVFINQLDPAQQKNEASKAIERIYGGLGATKVLDINKRLETLIDEQEGSSSSADVKSRQIDEFIKTINEEVGGPFADTLEKGRAAIQSRLTALSDTLDKEISLRETAFSKQFESTKALQDFRNSFIKTTFESETADRRGRTDSILQSIGRKTTGNDVADFSSLTRTRNVKLTELDAINNRSKIGIATEEEVRQKAKLVEEVNILGKALSELTDISQEVTKAQEALAKLEDKQSKLRGKASELAFGGRDARQGFARSLVAQKFVSAGGNLQSLPEDIRAELFSFLQEFGDAKVFNGQSGTDIINKQTANFLKQLGYSTEQVSSLMTDLQPIEKKQLEALLEVAKNTAAIAANNLLGFSRGGQARGVDTIPAMVAPGEFIVSAANAKKNKGLLHSINNGTVYAAKGGEIGANRVKRVLKASDSGADFAIGNDSVITASQLDSSIRSLVNDRNINNTRRSLRLGKSVSDNNLINGFIANTSPITANYGKVISALFGTDNGKQDGNRSSSLFSKAVYRNGVFRSGVLNQEYLANNRDSLMALAPALSQLADVRSSKEGAFIDNLTNRRFSKSMINLREAFNQSLGLTDPQVAKVVKQQKLAKPAANDPFDQALIDLIVDKPANKAVPMPIEIKPNQKIELPKAEVAPIAKIQENLDREIAINRLKGLEANRFAANRLEEKRGGFSDKFNRENLANIYKEGFKFNDNNLLNYRDYLKYSVRVMKTYSVCFLVV